MDSEDPAVAALRRLVATEGGESAVAAAIHSTKATIWQITNGIKLPSGRPRSVGRDLRERLDKRFPGWLEDTPRPEGVSIFSVAQDLSQQDRHPLPLPRLLTESEVLSGSDELFRLEVEDASGGNEYPEGSFVIWSRSRKRKFGRIVLIKDAAGRLHIRRLVQSDNNAGWIGEPLHPAFKPIDGAVQGVAILAVYEGSMLPPEKE